MRDIWDRVQIRELGATRLKRFVGMIYKLLKEDKRQFDVLLVGGNTGITLGRVTQEVFDQLNTTRPPLLAIPFVRYKPRTEESVENFVDNTIFQYDIQNQIRNANIKDIKNVLFVDDEIGDGHTAEGCMQALLMATGIESSAVDYHIVAEDYGFKETDIKIVKTSFHPFAKEIEGLNNIVGYSIPTVIDREIREILPDDPYDVQRRFNILLDLPCRDKKDLYSGYNYRLNEMVRQGVLNIEDLKTKFSKFLSELISEGIDAYKKGKIDFDDDSYANKFIEKE